MKEQHEHLMLWQKRNELRIEDDVQHDWQNMQGILDQHLPVAHTPGAGTACGTMSSNLSYLSGFKLLTAIIIASAISVIAYYVFVKGNGKTNAPKKANTTVGVNLNNNTIDSESVVNGIKTINHSAGTDSTANNNNETPITNTVTEPNAVPGSSALSVNTIKSSNAKSSTTNSISDNNKTGSKALLSNTTNSIEHTGNNNADPAGSSAKRGAVSNKVKNSRSTLANAASISKNHGVDKTKSSKNATTLIANHNSSHSRLAGHSLTIPGGRPGRQRGVNGGSLDKRISGSDKNEKSANFGQIVSANLKDNMIVDRVKNTDNTLRDSDLIQPFTTPLGITNFVDGLSPFLIKRAKAALDSEMAAKKPQSIKITGPSKFDYGILLGVNASGSFTAQDHNKNFYGSFPVDIYFGAFTTYNFNDKWGLNLQLRGLNPQTVSGTYTHINESKKDTNQVLTMTDSRKIYTADAAIHLIFKPVTGLSLKAGPVFGYALKEANGNTTFQTGPLKKDSAYYVGVTKLVNATTYSKSLNIGLSAGASYRYGRFIFDAAYIRNFTGVTIGSTLGSYTAISNQFLFSVGFKLNRTK